MNAPSAPVRFILLLSMIALFVAAWAGDRPSSGSRRPAAFAALPRRFAETAIVDAGPEADAAVSGCCRINDAHAVERTEEVVAVSFDALICGMIPLPEDLAPGEYHIAGADGSLHSLKITVAELKALGRTRWSARRELYTAEDGARRWYYVSLDRESGDRHVLQDEVSPSNGSAIAAGDIQLLLGGAQRLAARVSGELTPTACRASMAWDRMMRRRSAWNRRMRGRITQMVNDLRGGLHRLQEPSSRIATEPGDAEAL